MNRRIEFRKELIQYFEEKGYKVSEAFCIKNNGERDGIVFHNKSAFSPVLYLEDLYEKYSRGISVSKLAEKMIARLSDGDEMEKMLQEFPVMNLLCDYAQIRRNVRLCMVSKSTNKSLLAETPHRDYGDFAAIVYWMQETESNISMRMLMNRNALNKMKADFDTVFKDAYINMMGEFELKSMEDVLYELIAQQLKTEEMGEIPAEQYIQRMCQGMELYLLTHKSGVFGSAALCYQRELDKASERIGGDYIIIPSSINELILVPFRRNIPLEAISELVRQINAEQLDQEERLAENVYIYLEKEKRLINDREYLQKTQNERVSELHQRSEYAAREEWRNDRCLM